MARGTAACADKQGQPPGCLNDAYVEINIHHQSMRWGGEVVEMATSIQYPQVSARSAFMLFALHFDTFETSSFSIDVVASPLSNWHRVSVSRDRTPYGGEHRHRISQMDWMATRKAESEMRCSCQGWYARRYGSEHCNARCVRGEGQSGTDVWPEIS
jgi:hypothetical protein